jgi:integrase
MKRITTRPGPRPKRKRHFAEFSGRDESRRGAATRLAAIDDDGGESEAAVAMKLGDGLTLSKFFELWYLPRVLQAKQVTKSTLDSWTATIDWWRFLTNDPPLREISDQLCFAFVAELKTTTFSRGAKGRQISLAPMTQRRHSRHLRALLQRAGKTVDPGRPGAGLIDHIPAVPTVKAFYQQKPAFTLEHARRIAAMCDGMVDPIIAERFSTPLWWKARLALLYYTGLRVGTVTKLRWRHVSRDENGQTWLNIPRELVPKTNKALRIAVHPQLEQVLKRMRWGRNENHLITPEACCMSWFADLHLILQQRAGIPPAQCQPPSVLAPHAWGAARRAGP